MIALIILCKNQVNYLSQIISKIQEMSAKADKIYYVMDRDSSSDVELARKLVSESNVENMCVIENTVIPSNMGRPMLHDGEEHFLAGYCRNTTLDIAIKDGCTEFIFIDGDCLPEINIISGYHKYLSSDNPMAICGKRNDFQHNFRDQREFNEYDNMFKEELNEVTNYKQVLDSAVLWTCNFGMNISAVNRIRYINKLLYGFDEVFSSFFLGTWGGEDGFLGVECFLDKKVTLAGIGVPRTGITHIHHERPIKKYSHETFMSKLESMRHVHEYMVKTYDKEIYDE